MAKPRTELHAILKTITDNVYFQPPESLKLKYPCIVYSRTGSKAFHADNMQHHNLRRYTVTLIDEDPDSPLLDKIEAALEYCSHGQFYVSDNLNHDTFTVYF